jgi:hypothetical protein
LREEPRLRVFENGVLCMVFGPKGDEVTGKWRTLHNEEFDDLYSSFNIIRMIKLRRMLLTGYVVCMRERRGVCTVSVRKTYEKESTWKTQV